MNIWGQFRASDGSGAAQLYFVVRAPSIDVFVAN